MAQNGGISADEFTRLQSQLIELRTQNYEIAEKFRKAKDESNALQERVDSKEKELQKFSKLMKLPGLQAFTKNKNKKNYDEVVEENERLIHQMQRHEEDFNLQNKTLLEEVSRLSTERDEFENELKKLKDSRNRQLDENDELRRIKAENTALHRKLQDYESRSQITAEDASETGRDDHVDSACAGIVSDSDAVNANNVKEYVERAVRDLIKNERHSDDSMQHETLSDEQNTVVEKLIAFFDSLVLKAHSASDSSILSQEMNVSLETEQAENQLLRDQIKEERGKASNEIESLRVEVEKLTEKAKRKQEVYIQLTEEKEALHAEKKHLEQEWIKTKEQLAQSVEASTDFEQQVLSLSKEKEDIQNEVISMREKIEHCSPEKLSELTLALQGKNEELMTLKSQLEESSSLNQDMMSEVQKLSDDKDRATNEANENLELAKKRKKLLDELSVERQNELVSHKQEVEDMKKEKEEQKNQLEKLMSDLEKARREVTLATDRHSELLKTSDSLEKKCGWLERTLKETESQTEAARKQYEEDIAQRENEFNEKKGELRIEHQMEIDNLNEEKKEIEVERDERSSIIEKMKQMANDKEVEFRVNSKKNDQLLKDLKRQLKAERKRADQIQQRLQDFLSESKTKQTFDELFRLDPSLQKSHRRQDSGSHLSTVSSGSGLEMSTDGDPNKTSTPLSGTPMSSGSDVVRMNSETMELISKVADLQLEKNVLEEKLHHLEENSSMLVEDLMRKTEIIQNYVRDTKTDLQTDASKKKSMTLKEKMKDSLHIGKHGKSEDMLKEINLKMQRVLEETLEKNIQMEKHIDQLTKELETRRKTDST